MISWNLDFHWFYPFSPGKISFLSLRNPVFINSWLTSSLFTSCCFCWLQYHIGKCRLRGGRVLANPRGFEIEVALGDQRGPALVRWVMHLHKFWARRHVSLEWRPMMINPAILTGRSRVILLMPNRTGQLVLMIGIVLRRRPRPSVSITDRVCRVIVLTRSSSFGNFHMPKILL